MSRFYGSVKGRTKAATRQGTERSGIESHTRGWALGVKVYGYVDEDDNDAFRVVLTSGSGPEGLEHDLGTFTREDLDAFLAGDKAVSEEGMVTKDWEKANARARRTGERDDD